MKIDLGHNHWRLVVNYNGGEDGYQNVRLDVSTVEDENKEVFWGSRPNTTPALSARQLKDSSFIGRISLNELFLTETGFEAQGIALEEEGTFYPDGVHQIQRWQAERRYE